MVVEAEGEEDPWAVEAMEVVAVVAVVLVAAAVMVVHVECFSFTGLWREMRKVKLTKCQAKCLTESVCNKFECSRLQTFFLLLNIGCDGTSSP